jgi:hypothetical protein
MKLTGESRSTRRKSCHSDTLSTTNPTWTVTYPCSYLLCAVCTCHSSYSENAVGIGKRISWLVCTLESKSFSQGIWRDVIFFCLVKGPAADATDAPQPWDLLCNPVMKMISVFSAEWNWQGKAEVLGEKPVPVPLCPPQNPHGMNRDRTRASAVGDRRLTPWAMARPDVDVRLQT